MQTLLNELVHINLHATGQLIFPDRNIPVDIQFTQYFNGRISFEAKVEDQNWAKIPNQLTHSKSDFSGNLEDGRNINAKGILIENKTYEESGEVGYDGYVYYPGYVEITMGDTQARPFREFTCELTNLPLMGKGPVQMELNTAIVIFSETKEYKLVRKVMSLLRGTGILCEMRVVFNNDVDFDESDRFVSLLCGLLSLSQRTHVRCVSMFFGDETGQVVRWFYQEPVFHYFKPNRPLIPVEHLHNFLQATIMNYRKKYQVWKLGFAQDYYLQSLALHSAWPQSIGFFTALETLKQAFLEQFDTQHKLERYLSEGRFKKNRISSKVLDLL